LVAAHRRPRPPSIFRRGVQWCGVVLTPSHDWAPPSVLGGCSNGGAANGTGFAWQEDGTRVSGSLFFFSLFSKFNSASECRCSLF
jgi:hypothetical protein